MRFKPWKEAFKTAKDDKYRFAPNAGYELKVWSKHFNELEKHFAEIYIDVIDFEACKIELPINASEDDADDREDILLYILTNFPSASEPAKFKSDRYLILVWS